MINLSWKQLEQLKIHTIDYIIIKLVILQTTFINALLLCFKINYNI